MQPGLFNDTVRHVDFDQLDGGVTGYFGKVGWNIPMAMPRNLNPEDATLFLQAQTNANAAAPCTGLR